MWCMCARSLVCACPPSIRARAASPSPAAPSTHTTSTHTHITAPPPPRALPPSLHASTPPRCAHVHSARQSTPPSTPARRPTLSGNCALICAHATRSADWSARSMGDWLHRHAEDEGAWASRPRVLEAYQQLVEARWPCNTHARPAARPSRQVRSNIVRKYCAGRLTCARLVGPFQLPRAHAWRSPGSRPYAPIYVPDVIGAMRGLVAPRRTCTALRATHLSQIGPTHTHACPRACVRTPIAALTRIH